MKSTHKKIDFKTIAEATYRKTSGIGLKHALANKAFMLQTIHDLKNRKHFDQPAAIVLSAGPSLHRTHTAEKIVKSGFSGPIIATDGALGYCLRNGLVPDFVVCVDPHPTRIVRWFGDMELKEHLSDDYFRHQDLDPKWLANEERYNRDLIDLVNAKGPRMSMIFSTSVSPSVTRRAVQAKSPIYWFNPIYDDYDDPKSHTQRIYKMNKAPCLVTGGNVGTLAWVFAGAVLRAKNVVLAGMDFSYHPDTPLDRTQYHKELKELFGKSYADYYIHVDNPYLKQRWFTDPTYWWYRDCFLKMARVAPFKTTNCTEGGILFGKSIRWEGLNSFLATASNGSRKGAH